MFFSLSLYVNYTSTKATDNTIDTPENTKEIIFEMNPKKMLDEIKKEILSPEELGKRFIRAIFSEINQSFPTMTENDIKIYTQKYLGTLLNW